MQDFDVALKLLLRRSAQRTIRELIGADIEKWIDVELPKVQNLRADLLGETASGDLVHVELQSGNDALMPLRMAEYCLGILRVFGRFPRRFCFISANRRCAWKVNCAARMCCSATA